MASGSRTHVDRDGVRVVERAHGVDGRLVAGAIVLAALAVGGLGWMAIRGDDGGPRTEPAPASGDVSRVARTPAPPADAVAAGTAVPAAPAVARAVPRRARAAARAAAAAAGSQRDVTLADVKPLLDGSREGIGVFPLPGTDPPKAGIIVPEDFPLPEGYVRHHQVTDDGQPLPPILMFHPDYEWTDAAGHPIATPESRVVPPELAPPGLPIRMLEVPAGAGGQGRDR